MSVINQSHCILSFSWNELLSVPNCVCLQKFVFGSWYIDVVSLVDVLIARSWAKFSPRISKVRATFKQVSKYFSIKHISHRVIHYYALVACAFLDNFVIHVRLCCFQFRLTVTKSGPYVVTINIKWVFLDFSSLD